jgi:hypothetical protein
MPSETAFRQTARQQVSGTCQLPWKPPSGARDHSRADFLTAAPLRLLDRWRSLRSGSACHRTAGSAVPLAKVSRGQSRQPASTPNRRPACVTASRGPPSKLVVPSSSLVDNLGRVRCVKAKPVGAGRFARLDTEARGQGRAATRRTGEEQGTAGQRPVLLTHLLTRLPGTGETRRVVRNAGRVGAQVAGTHRHEGDGGRRASYCS